jgi:hypothetical protein
VARQIYLSVLFFQESPGIWIAQGLERDIAAHGPSIEAAKVAFERTVVGYFRLDRMRHREPLSTLKPAPATFWNAWERVRRQKMEAEALPSIDAYMIPAVTSEFINA